MLQINIIAILIICTQAVTSGKIRSSRSLSLFSVVSFPNEECPDETVATPGMNGICITSEECSNRNGLATVNCASGFGVCCVVTITECGTVIESNRNITYLQNVGYPGGFTTPNTPCTYRFKANSDICHLRFDFLNGAFSDPDPDPAAGCNMDIVTFQSPSGIAPPSICGQLAGQHVYLETSKQEAAINVNTLAGASSRTWNIKVSQIECESPNRVPADCVQYYTGNTGVVTSFNFPNGMIPNTEYSICLRQNEGFCSFALSESGVVPDPFDLSAPATSVVGTNCVNAVTGNQAFIEVQSINKLTDRFCGKFLSSVNGDTKSGAIVSTGIPFRIGVFAINAIQQANGGFNLMFSQRPCGIP